MAVVLALGKLYDDVTARFAAEGLANVAQPFGQRAVSRQDPPYPRIVWVPGDDAAGIAGEDLPPKFPGGNPRPLAALNEFFTCYISAVERSSEAALANERLQWQAARELYDAWRRAVYLAASPNVAIKSIQWHEPAGERRYGATLRVVGAILSVVPDSADAEAPVDTVAELSTTMLGVTEVEIVE